MKTRIFLLAVAAALWTTVVGQSKTIIEQQCWLDGNIAAAQPASTSVDISALAPGVHSYSIRVKDSEGMWSSVVTKYFIIPRAIEPATNIAAREYWLDGKVALRASLDASPAQISLTDLAAGLHSFTMRVKDNNGSWSSPVTKFFLVPAQETTIARYMYWFDDDEANRVIGELTAASGVLPVAIGHLSEGEHMLSWRVADSRGVWSNTMVGTFTFTRVQLADAMVSLADNWFEFTGYEIRPAVTVTNGETVLTEDVDFTVAYTANVYPGTAGVLVAAVENGAYKGEVATSFIIAKAASVVVTPPVALEDLLTTGEPVVLITAGEAVGGQMQYSLDGENYSAELPAVIKEGTYTVYYKVAGDENHYDTEPETLIVVVEKGTMGIDEISNDKCQMSNAKILRDGQLLILRNGKTYTATGAEVK